MSRIYARGRNGTLEPVKTLHVFAEAGLDTKITEFSQMNDPVTAFLSAADAAYTDDNGGSVSVIADYETAEGDADRPLGYPLTATSGTLYLQNEDSGNGWNIQVSGGDVRNAIYNAIPGTVSQYLVKDANGRLLENGRIRPTGKVRMIRFYGNNRNCRDLGGWACDGGTVNYGKLFRSAVLASREDWIDPLIGENIGIRHHIDFRSDEEASYITESTLGSRVRYQRFPLELYYADCINIGSSDFSNLKKIYRTIIEAAIHGEGVVYNCSLGRDRTGTVTFLLLALLGVAQADIDKDYELSSFSGLEAPTVLGAHRTRVDYQNIASYLSTFGGTTLRDNAVWWFIKAGFTLAELNAFRAAMSTDTPDELTAENFVATYTITNNLTGCITSNEAITAEDGAGYTAALSFADGYKHWKAVSVAMGGADVTADVYEDGVIMIPAVTGNVIITAVAAKYINQIPISTDTDGSIFNNVGYMLGYRINSSGGLTEASTVWVTGFIPCKTGNAIRFKNYEVFVDSASLMEQRIAFYDSDKNVVSAPYWSEIVNLEGTAIGSDNQLQSFVVPENSQTIAYARFANFNTTSASIITVNEEID